MKRSLALVIALSMFACTTSFAAIGGRSHYSKKAANSVAPDRVGQWELGMFFGGAFNSDSDDVGFVGGAINYGLTPWIALGVEAGWQEGAISSDEDSDLGMIPIMADLIIRFPNVHQTLVPYGVVGLGVIGSYITDENGSGPNNNGDDTDDTAFGWKIGLGVDWFLNSNWIMNFEWAYYDSDPDLVSSVVSDTNFWTLVAGVKYLY